MQTTNQPQTTNNPMGRDASVQISGGRTKKTAIWMGLDADLKKRDPDATPEHRDCLAVVDLSGLLADLTSADKLLREKSKKRVRELVALGMDAAI